MLTYSYVARETATGKKISAEVQAENETAAARLLTERGMAPLDITVKKDKEGLTGLFNRIPTKQKVIFSRQLATLINAGLPLVQSLNTVRNQTPNKNFKNIISKIISDVEGGSTLSNALAAHPKVFDDVYVSLVAAGETSGTLDNALTRLANQQEKDAETVSKVRGAMVYPALVVFVLVAVVAFLLTTVLPKVEDLYNSLPGVSLPFVTRVLLAVSDFMIHWWWLILLVIIAGSIIGVRWSRTEKGRLFWDRFKMNAWGIGSLYMMVYMARFSRTSATLVVSGVPMVRMLQTTAKAVDNRHIEASINRVIEQVKGGKPLSEALAGDKNFLDLVPSMIKIGEQSGTLGDMLTKLADYYEKELDNKIKNISTTVEPILMIVVGIMALLVVAAVLLPIYSLAGKNLIQRY